jgi:hypothetical protein
MTELSFLLDLLLWHKLPKATKEAITSRIKDIESQAVFVSPSRSSFVQKSERTIASPPEIISLSNPDGTMSQIDLSKQSPSTRAKLLAQEQPSTPTILGAPREEVSNPPIIAQTPAAVAAMSARQQAIAIAISGKEEKGRTSPRKF